MSKAASMKKFRGIRLRMIAICWLYFIFVGFCTVASCSGFPDSLGQFLAQLIFIALTLKCGLHLHRLYSLKKGGCKYMPQRRFMFLRKPDAERLKFHRKQRKIASVIGCLLFIIMLMQGNHTSDQFFRLVLLFGGWIGAITYSIAQIENHTEKDEVNLFELEDIGVIGGHDIVTALYKDFETWQNVEEGSKILLLTQDELVAIIFKSATSAQKFCLPLSKIDRLDIIRNTRWLAGDGFSFLFAAGAQGQSIAMALAADSYQDSPESFFQKMLQDLDNALLNKPRPQAEARVRDEGAPPSSLRKIDFEEVKLEEGSAPGSGTRIIDL